MDSERIRYIYYGNDLIAEVKVTVNSNGTVTNSTLSRGYHWQRGGAGEAWRLLSVRDYERGTRALPGYDGRGNIVTWTNGATGELIGTADHGPYGERFDIWWQQTRTALRTNASASAQNAATKRGLSITAQGITARR